MNNSMPANVLVLLALDGYNAMTLAFAESASTQSVFADPPAWHPGAKEGLAIPYRVQASIQKTPVHTSVLKVLIAHAWRKQGLAVKGFTDWFEVDAATFEQSVREVLDILANPALAQGYVNRLCDDAKATPGIAQSAELWEAAEILWPLTEPIPGELTPLETAMELLTQAVMRGERGSIRDDQRRVYDIFTKVLSEKGSLSVHRWEMMLQAHLGNEGPHLDAKLSYLKSVAQAYDRGHVPMERVELECRLMLQYLHGVPYREQADEPLLSSVLPLSLREGLVSMAESVYESDTLYLGWIKKQLIPSFMLDPVYRKRIFAGMGVCSLVVLYLSPGTFVLMSLLAGIGYYSVKRRG